MFSSLVLQLLVIFVTAHQCQDWAGELCFYQGVSYESSPTCVYRTPAGCLQWRNHSQAIYTQLPYCCPGWRESSPKQCNEAICNPSCPLGMLCIFPDTCFCTPGGTGGICRNRTICDFESPCYPGTCERIGSSELNCTCTKGFEHLSGDQADFCRGLSSDETPQIYETRGRISMWNHNVRPSIEEYSLLVDSTNSSSTNLWTNLRNFNWVSVSGTAVYENIHITASPVFISRFGLGVVRAQVRLQLHRITNGVAFVEVDQTLSCDAPLSFEQPQPKYTCEALDTNLLISAQHANELTLSVLTWSGGYRVPYQVDPPQDHAVQEYVGPMSSSDVRVLFDFEKPVHNCLNQTTPCANDAFRVEDDITKNGIRLRWSNWVDLLSGMNRYAWEVFKLEANANGLLREKAPLGPIFGPDEILQSISEQYEAEYTPPYPGVYSFILEASDKANNSVYVRRLAIYDPLSNISLDASRKLYISSANPKSDYRWQNNVLANIEVRWNGHFVNIDHEGGMWLNSVLAYPPQLSNRKIIPRDGPEDDHDGSRTVNPINNRRGIVKFEIAFRKDATGGHDVTEPTSNWIDVGLSEQFTIDPSTVGTGVTLRDTVIVWVRATDVMGNSLVDSTKVSYDQTPPEESNPTFQPDVRADGAALTSRLAVSLNDQESGLKQFQMTVYKGSDGQRVRTVSYNISGVPAHRCTACSCPVALTECFELLQSFAINNCHIFTEGENAVTLELTFSNMAALEVTETIRVNNIVSLDGAEPRDPANLGISGKNSTAFTLTWHRAPSCRTGVLWITYDADDGTKRRMPVDWFSSSYQVTDLEPGTEYTVRLISQYSWTTRTSSPITVRTDGGFGSTVSIAIAVIFCLLFLAVIFGLLPYQLGIVPGICQRQGNKIAPR